MKRHKIILFVFALVSLFAVKGCILDAFDTLTQNIPISKEFTVQGNSSSVQQVSNFCLSESSTINDYRGKIENIELATATYQTVSVTPANTKGDLSITLAKSDGTVLYTFTLTNASPASYINNPYVLQFTQAQIQLINTYLGTLKDGTCFKATLGVTNISPSGQSISLVGKVDIVFKMKAKP
jgi:hypothetical protein